MVWYWSHTMIQYFTPMQRGNQPWSKRWVPQLPNLFAYRESWRWNRVAELHSRSFDLSWTRPGTRRCGRTSCCRSPPWPPSRWRTPASPFRTWNMLSTFFRLCRNINHLGLRWKLRVRKRVEHDSYTFVNTFSTVKLGYNKLGYGELRLIMNI